MPVQRPGFSGVARLFLRLVGCGEPGIPCWPSCHAFRRSGMRELKPHPWLFTCCPYSHACHSGAPDIPEFRVYYRGPVGLVNLGFPFGRVVMSFVEVVCVGTSLTPFFSLVTQSAVALTLTHGTPAPRFLGVARLFPRSLGSSEPGIPFWPRCHAFRGSAICEFKPHPLLFTCDSECGGHHSHACHSSAPYFPELRVYSRRPFGLVRLGFHFGRVVMRFVEVACVSSSLTPCFSLVPKSAVALTLTHATPAPQFPGVARQFPKSLGSSKPGIPFWPRCHAFRRSGMRKCKPHPLFRTCAS